MRFCFSGEERNIKSCKNVRLYESTKDKIKKKIYEQNKGSLRATYDVENDLGGLILFPIQGVREVKLPPPSPTQTI